MKTILTIILLCCALNSVLAQQAEKSSEAILLEYYQTQRYAEAAAYLKTIYPEPVTDNKALGGLAYTSQMAGKLADAEGYYKRLLLNDSTNISVMFNLGNLNIRRGNNAKAMSFYRAILVVDSNNFNVYKQLANLSEKKSNIDSAIFFLQKANKLNPVEPDVAFDLSKYYISLKQYPLADKVLTEAIAADTSNMLLMLGKARLMYETDKPDETIKLCNILVDDGLTSYEVIKWLGTAYYIKKKYNESIAAFKKLDETNSQNEASLYYTGMSYKALGNQVQAIASFREALKDAISGNVDSYYAEIADSFDKMGKKKSAVTAYKKALQFDEKPMTYYALANLYDERMKDTAAAISYYKKYLASNPPERQKGYVDYVKDRVIRLRQKN